MRTMLAAPDRVLCLGALCAVAALTLLAPGGLAQTPVSDPDLASGVHPAHIHAGTCAELGEVIAPLLEVMIPVDAIREGAETAHPAKLSQSHVDLALQDLIDGEYAINIALSAKESETSIACGDIGGYVITDPAGRTELFFGLRETNDSGHTGVVRLGVGDDPNQTEISVQLVEPDEMR